MLRERPHHIETVQQSATRPNLPIVGPTPLHPRRARALLAQAVKHEPRRGNCLAFENSSTQRSVEAATYGQEGGALLVCLANEGQLGFTGNVANLVSAHCGTLGADLDLMRRVRLYVILLTEEYVSTVLRTRISPHGLT